MIKIANNLNFMVLKQAAEAAAEDFKLLRAKKSETTATYRGATEDGKVPAAAILALLGGGAGAAGGYFASDDKNKKRNAIIAGLLGAGAGAATGYYGNEMSTGIKGRNTKIDPTEAGLRAGNTWQWPLKGLREEVNNVFSFGNSDTPLTVGQLALGLQNYANDRFFDITGVGARSGGETSLF